MKCTIYKEYEICPGLTGEKVIDYKSDTMPKLLSNITEDGYHHYKEVAEEKYGVQMLYVFLDNRNDVESITESVNKIYDELGKKKADEVIDMLCGGCRASVNDFKKATRRKSITNDSEDVDAYSYAEEEMAKEFDTLYPLVGIGNYEYDMNVGIGLAVWYREMLHEYKALSYEDIHAINTCSKKATIDDMFNLAISGLEALEKSLTIARETQKKQYLVGKSFKEYLSSEEFLGKRKTLKR